MSSVKILKGITQYEFDITQYQEIHSQLLLSTKKERLGMKGLIVLRVDMIVVATAFVNFIIHKLGIKRMKLSTYALKEGALWAVINNLL